MQPARSASLLPPAKGVLRRAAMHDWEAENV
jgi:hypothetical protein